MLMLNNLTEEQRLAKAVVAIMGNPKYTALAGVLMIGDKRLVTKGYGKAFINSLPPMPRSDNIADVEAFFSSTAAAQSARQGAAD